MLESFAGARVRYRARFSSFIVIDKLPARRSLPPSPRLRRTGGEGGFRMNGKPGRVHSNNLFMKVSERRSAR